MTVSRPASPPSSGPPPALLLPSPIHHSLLPRGAGQCTGRHNSTYFGQVLIIAPCSLPILHRIIETGADACCGRSSQSPQAVIITPTRELAIQIYDEARKFAHGSGAKAGILYGGTSTGGQAEKLRLVSFPVM